MINCQASKPLYNKAERLISLSPCPLPNPFSLLTEFIFSWIQLLGIKGIWSPFAYLVSLIKRGPELDKIDSHKKCACARARRLSSLLAENWLNRQHARSRARNGQGWPVFNGYLTDGNQRVRAREVLKNEE